MDGPERHPRCISSRCRAACHIGRVSPQDGAELAQIINTRRLHGTTRRSNRFWRRGTAGPRSRMALKELNRVAGSPAFARSTCPPRFGYCRVSTMRARFPPHPWRRCPARYQALKRSSGGVSPLVGTRNTADLEEAHAVVAVRPVVGDRFQQPRAQRCAQHRLFGGERIGDRDELTPGRPARSTSAADRNGTGMASSRPRPTMIWRRSADRLGAR